MHKNYVQRKIESDVKDFLSHFPAVAVLGPRQCGKSTLAKHILSSFPESLYLDLERPSDLNKLISDPETFFEWHASKLICLDEIQRVPQLFPLLRSVIDDRARAGQFIILGSASEDLLRQSSETLAGRLIYQELTPFLFSEVETMVPLRDLWLKGGFPGSLFASEFTMSYSWRHSFIQTFLEKDIPQLGLRLSPLMLRRFFQMSAHNHGQLFNANKLSQALGVSSPTVTHYLDILEKCFVLRRLPPYIPNLKKRLVKSHKVYFRDTGLLHALLQLENYDDLLGHPIYGQSWEGFVIETVIQHFKGWQSFFYRDSNGVEVDLILEKGTHRIAIECKASQSPSIHSTLKNRYEKLMDELGIHQLWIVAPVQGQYPIGKTITVSSLKSVLESKPL